MNPIAVLGLGLLLGLRHAADPDHVVAVTTIAARTRRVLPATLLGLAWGLGHTLTLLVVAGAIIAFNWVVPPRLGLAMEFLVALALILIGLLNLRHAPHPNAEFDVLPGRPPAGRAFLVGIVHGLAGSAAVALLVVATVHDPALAGGYLLLFSFGTLVGMALITTGFAVPVVTAAERWGGAGRWIRMSTGALSLVFGAWLVLQIGWVDGLFRAAVHWSPK
jgi:high-affinity nickel-transport protein